MSDVHDAMVAVMREVTAVGKDGVNRDQGYAFRGADDTVTAVAPAMRRHGLTCRPVAIDGYALTRVAIGKGNTELWRASAAVTYHWCVTSDHPDTIGGRDVMPATVVAEAMDTADKATAKMMTVAYRTCLLQGLALPVADADEVTPAMSRAMMARLSDAGIRARDDRLRYLAGIIGRDVDTSKEMTSGEWQLVMSALEALLSDPRPGADETPE